MATVDEQRALLRLARAETARAYRELAKARQHLAALERTIGGGSETDKETDHEHRERERDRDTAGV